MKRRQFAPEKIIGLLRQAEVELAQGKRVGEVRRGLGISEQSYYRWRTEYGDLKRIFLARATDPSRLLKHLRHLRSRRLMKLGARSSLPQYFRGRRRRLRSSLSDVPTENSESMKKSGDLSCPAVVSRACSHSSQSFFHGCGAIGLLEISGEAMPEKFNRLPAHLVRPALAVRLEALALG
jgi:putative transposase